MSVRGAASPADGFDLSNSYRTGAAAPARPGSWRLLDPRTWSNPFARGGERAPSGSQCSEHLAARAACAASDAFDSHGYATVSKGSGACDEERIVPETAQLREVTGNARYLNGRVARMAEENKVALALGGTATALGVIANRDILVPPVVATGRALGHGTVFAVTSLGNGAWAVGGALVSGVAACSRFSFSALVGGCHLLAGGGRLLGSGLAWTGHQATADRPRSFVTGAAVGGAAAGLTAYFLRARPQICYVKAFSPQHEVRGQHVDTPPASGWPMDPPPHLLQQEMSSGAYSTVADPYAALPPPAGAHRTMAAHQSPGRGLSSAY